MPVVGLTSLPSVWSAASRRFFNISLNLLILSPLVEHYDLLDDILVAIQHVHPTDIDLDRIEQKVEHELLNLLGSCGREEQCLLLELSRT
jgi:hypothetical protein